MKATQSHMTQPEYLFINFDAAITYFYIIKQVCLIKRPLFKSCTVPGMTSCLSRSLALSNSLSLAYFDPTWPDLSHYPWPAYRKHCPWPVITQCHRLMACLVFPVVSELLSLVEHMCSIQDHFKYLTGSPTFYLP